MKYLLNIQENKYFAYLQNWVKGFKGKHIFNSTISKSKLWDLNPVPNTYLYTVLSLNTRYLFNINEDNSCSYSPNWVKDVQVKASYKIYSMKISKQTPNKSSHFKLKTTIPLTLGKNMQLVKKLFVRIILLKRKFYNNNSKVNSSP